MPGTTRDRAYGNITWQGKRFSLVDTGGLVSLFGKTEDLTEQIQEQTKIAMEEADVVVLLLAADESITEKDKEIIRYFRYI